MKKIALGVGAHADDMDFTSSGTFAKLVEEGWDAYYVICTDGSRGSRENHLSHEELTRMRREEQLAAGRVLGLRDVLFLNYVDTQLICDVALKEDLVRIIRTLKPNLVISMDPAFLYTKSSPWDGKAFVNHSDHRAAALATMDAVYPMARDRSIFPEHARDGLTGHITDELWFTTFENKADHFIDIETTLDKKMKALEEHKSQFEDFSAVKEGVRKRAQLRQKESGFTYSEGFVRLVFES